MRKLGDQIPLVEVEQPSISKNTHQRRTRVFEPRMEQMASDNSKVVDTDSTQQCDCHLEL
jgi:hypothetical protein